MIPITAKSKAFEAYICFTTWLFTHHGRKVKYLQCDNNTIILGGEFTNYLDSQGMVKHLTVHDNPSMNGVAEHMHQTIFNGVRVMLLHAQLPQFLWARAMWYSMWICNHSPSKVLDYKTLFEKHFGEPFALDDLHQFGQWVVIKNNESNKLCPCSNYGHWIGYTDESKGHLIWTNKVCTEHNIQFLTARLSEIEGEDTGQAPVDDSLSMVNDNASNIKDVPDIETPPEPHWSKHKTQLTKRSCGLNFDKDIAKAITEFRSFKNSLDDNPLTFQEAMSHVDHQQWHEAMISKIKSLQKQETWSVIKLPTGANIIGTQFVYKIKQNANGSIECYKAQLVAQGFRQMPGIDFEHNDRYALVTRMAAIQTLLSWAASMDYEIHQVDIKSAYLYGKLKDDEIIFIHPPPGNLLKGVSPGHALKLNKALYGLKQAGHHWYKTLE